MIAEKPFYYLFSSAIDHSEEKMMASMEISY